MIAARRLVTVYLLEELTQTSAPRVSESRRRRCPCWFPQGGNRPTVSAVSSRSRCRRTRLVLRKYRPDPIDSDEAGRLAWIGKLICLLTAMSTSSTIVWALVG
jgi:hypothetical protein